jgi:hyperosmotically inducible periplasmic protein
MDKNSTLGKIEQEASDSLITTKVKTILAGDNMLNVFTINVKTENGNVALTGDLEDEEDIDHAIKLASSIDGVKKVRFKILQ